MAIEYLLLCAMNSKIYFAVRTALKYISTSNPCIKLMSKDHWEDNNARFPLEMLILKLLPSLPDTIFLHLSCQNGACMQFKKFKLFNLTHFIGF